MKTVLTVILAALCTGCVVNTRTVDYTHAWPLQPAPNNEVVVINATTHNLSVLTDGRLTKEDLKPGETCTIQAWAYRSTEQMAITVIGIERAVTQSRTYELYRNGKWVSTWTVTDEQLRGPSQ